MRRAEERAQRKGCRHPGSTPRPRRRVSAGRSPKILVMARAFESSFVKALRSPPAILNAGGASASRQRKRFSAMAESSEIDWREMREDILAEHASAPNVADRVLCLKMHDALMNLMERTVIEPKNLVKFRETRSQEYALMLTHTAPLQHSQPIQR